MSNALAIAAVTYLLGDILRDGILNGNPTPPALGDVTVRALPPDRAPAMTDSTINMVNLFLYRVSPNTGWSNLNYPSHDSRGNRISNPPLALDLHYLITVFGAEDYVAEILLGYVMQILHETPILTSDAIQASLGGAVLSTGTLPPGLQTASASDLAHQFESIRITPHYIDMEEMSRIWSSAGGQYRTSVAYQVSVVLITAQKSTRSGLPVQAYFVEGRTLRPPRIESVLSSRGARLQIQEGDDFILTGFNFKSDTTRVVIGNSEVTPTGTDPVTNEPNLQDNRIRVTPPTDLRAGVVPVRVVHYFGLGDPPVDHRVIESNAYPVLYNPRITAPATVQSNVISGGRATADLRIMLAPDLGVDQRVTVYLNEATSPAPTDRDLFGYSVVAPTRDETDPADRVDVTFTNVHPAEYFVRVRVDGAESALNPTDPAAPRVDLTVGV